MKQISALILAFALQVTANAQSNPSDIAMTGFNAVPTNNHVVVAWTHVMSGVISYEVEKSKNGSEYAVVSKVEPGTVAADFVETDFQPYEGMSFYRLKFTTEEGFTYYSNTVPVKYTNGVAVSPVPQPAIKADQNPDKTAIVVVRNAAGEEYYSKVEVQNSGDPLEVKDLEQRLTSGTYTIVSCSEQSYFCKQMLVK